MKNKKLIQDIRKEVYSLFEKHKKNKYHEPSWIFPNHFDIMINLAKDMCKKYKGDIEICEIAVLLHDTGLVYKRNKKSPKGHEDRSIEFANLILTKYNYNKKQEVIKCILATDAKENPKFVNEKIVRTADALSQFISIHFFAKATFAEDWEFYKYWLEKKAKNNFKKICFPEERKKAKPVRDYIMNAIKLYNKMNK